MGDFDVVAEVETGPAARVLECGWQSWSPSGWYAVQGSGPRPGSAQGLVMGYRATSPRWKGQFQSEGLIAIQAENFSVTATSISADEPATFRAWYADGKVLIAADRAVRVSSQGGPAQVALSRWARQLGAQRGIKPLRPVPPGWCSWYFYGRAVTEHVVLAEMEKADDLGLPVQVALVDEGYEQALGDWLSERDGFGSLGSLAKSLIAMGKVPGIWIAPFVAASHSRVAREHPGWWLEGVSAGHVWDSDLLVLDVAAADAINWLTDVFGSLAELGFGFFKLDFMYAGTLAGGGGKWATREDIAGYRYVVESVRKAVGEKAFLAGCGAPLLPSVGLFDTMRVSSDVGTNWRPATGIIDGLPSELWYPSGQVAVRSCAARGFAHGNWWINDGDCIMARPQMERRQTWAGLISAWPGLRLSGDALGELDEEGLEITRRLLRAAATEPLTEASLTSLDALGWAASDEPL